MPPWGDQCRVRPGSKMGKISWGARRGMLVRAVLAALLTAGIATGLVSQPSAAQMADTRSVQSDWGTTVRPKAVAQRAKALAPSVPAGASSGAATSAAASIAGLAAGHRQGANASSIGLSEDGERTRFTLDLTAKTAFSVFSMSNPYRVIIDLDDVHFQLPAGAGQQGHGLVASYRYGLFAPGKARIVLDTTGPARMDTAILKALPGSPLVRLEIDLVPASATQLAAAELASAAETIESTPQDAPAARPEKARNKPLIVIDPGHGGIDPGAQGSHGYEKDVVLAVSREIRRALTTSRRYEVIMTRSTDVFVSLDQRIRISRQNQADLFVSVHADSLAQKELAQNIRGATVYTLSEKATDDRSRRLAEKENAADILAGLNVKSGQNDAQVRNILFDLVRRESANFSNDFRGLLLHQLRSRLTLAKDPTRSAPFKVLRQPGSPAVLIELGYMSNAEDEKLLGTPAWQRSVGEAVARSVDDFFARRPQRP